MSSENLELSFQRQSPTNTIVNRMGVWLAPIILLIVDYLAIVCSLLSSYYIRDSILNGFITSLPKLHMPSNYVYFIIPSIYIALFLFEGRYIKRLPLWQSIGGVLKVSLYATMVTITIMYFSGVSNEISRIFVLLNGFMSFCYLTIARIAIKRCMTKIGLWQKPVIIIGAGKTAEILSSCFQDEPGMGYNIVGLIEDNSDFCPLVKKYPLLGNFGSLERAISDSKVDDVIIATPGLKRDQLVDLVYRVQPLVKNVMIVPDLFGVPLNNMEVRTLFKERTVLLKVSNNLASPINCFIKRNFDLFIGSFVLVVTIPILLILSLLIKLDSYGPALHLEKRLGKNDNEFLCFKFRTMYVNGDEILSEYLNRNPLAKAEWEQYAKLRSFDPRVTKVGYWLRKFSLDELPQIVNVLLGNMSLVGPRPYLPREKVRMGYSLKTILETVPGITGLWQVSGRNNIDFDARLHMDSWYVRNWSLWQDVVILFKTIEVVLSRKGAY